MERLDPHEFGVVTSISGGKITIMLTGVKDKGQYAEVSATEFKGAWPVVHDAAQVQDHRHKCTCLCESAFVLEIERVST